MHADRLLKSLLAATLRRRALLKGGLGFSALGSIAAATGCSVPMSGPGGVKTADHQLGGAHVMGPASAPLAVFPRALPAGAPQPNRDSKSPFEQLSAFDYGRVSRLPTGQILREYTVVAQETEIEVARGVSFPAWTYNGTVPGPSIRCTEKDRLRIYFQNDSRHPHTIHFHGIHPAIMDGVLEQVIPGGSFVYEFEPEPWGLFLYHCHTMPIKKHVEKGLYGAFIVDPPTARQPARELLMLLNGFDTDLDGKNEFYAVNTIANYFVEHPIEIKVGELVRVYLVNMLEFDPVNSFHLHGNVFKLYRTGTSTTSYEITDTVMLCQGERAVLEFTYKYPGKYMFHAHQSEFAELGWMGFFDVKA